ncbi:glycerophosphodiester phosphodiesterase family protein [Gordonia alkaliphila]|uniref:glycerophosphodiester phosphodiesterase family protein n=1 Tax=Gordonia alkaliphila TaxID=1053547 RepID=UPI0031E6896D
MAVTHARGTTLLKWHRARRTATDPPFTAQRIVEGLRAGASVEVDLRIHADRGFAVLHDHRLDRETTGRGAVAATPAARLRTMALRDGTGKPSGHGVLLLEDLADLLADAPLPRSALLQLDYKQEARDLDARSVAAFAAATAPIDEHLILSCGDADAVRILTDAAPGVAVGFDPCHRGAAGRALASGDFAGFVDRACLASPRATTIYLEIPLVLGAADAGFDLIGAFGARGRAVDAYTLGGAANVGMVPIVAGLLELGVDQLTVDDPEGLLALLTDAD